MDIRIPIVLVMIFLSFILSDSLRGKRVYIFIISSLFIFESALRSMFIGPDDTYNYYNMFHSIPDIFSLDIVQLFLDGYVNMELYAKDPGFIVLVSLFHLFSDNYQVFLFFAALLYFIPLGIILYKYTISIKDLQFAYILHLALFHVIAMCCLRQQIATGISFIMFLSIVNGKYFKSILLFILGFTIHKSLVLVILPIVLVFFFSNKLKQFHFISFFVAILFFLFAHKVVTVMANFTKSDYYLDYVQGQGGGYTFLLLGELCSFFCYKYISAKDLTNNPFSFKYIYSMLPFLTIFVPLIIVDGAMIRISQYFTLYLLVLLPISIHSFHLVKNDSIKFLFLNLLLLALTFMQPFEYYFFWEYVPNPY